MKPLTLLLTTALAAQLSSCEPRAGAEPSLSGPQTWTSSRQVRSMAVWRDQVWAATPGGLLQADLATGSIVKRTAGDGIPETDLLSVEPAGDRLALVGRRTLSLFDGVRAVILPPLPGADPSRPPQVGALGERIFAAVGGAVQLLEPDVTGWRAVAAPEEAAFLASADNRLWVVGEKRVWSSTDGVEWSPRGEAPGEEVTAIAAAGDRVALGTRSAIHLTVGGRRRLLLVSALEGATHLAGLTIDGNRLLAAVHGSGLWHLDRTRPDAKLQPAGRAARSGKAAAEPDPAARARAAVVASGRVWLGTSDGLLRRSGDRWEPLSTTAEPPGNVCAVLAKHQGTVWLVTHDGGIGRLVDGRWEAGGGPARSHVLQLASAGERLWARHPDGTLSYLEGGDWSAFSPASSDRLKWASSVTAGGDGLWIGTWAGASLYRGEAAEASREDHYKIAALEGEPVTAVAARGDELWLGTARRGVAARGKDGEWRAWHEGNGLRDGWITSLAGEGERMWIGTFNGGLAMWDGSRWSHPDPIPTPSGRKITCLTVDRRGAVWAGTRAGLARCYEGKWAVLTEADGLAGSEIQCLLPDGETLWVGTRTGLTRIPLRHQSEPRPSGSDARGTTTSSGSTGSRMAKSTL